MSDSNIDLEQLKNKGLLDNYRIKLVCQSTNYRKC